MFRRADKGVYQTSSWFVATLRHPMRAKRGFSQKRLFIPIWQGILPTKGILYGRLNRAVPGVTSHYFQTSFFPENRQQRKPAALLEHSYGQTRSAESTILSHAIHIEHLSEALTSRDWEVAGFEEVFQHIEQGKGGKRRTA